MEQGNAQVGAGHWDWGRRILGSRGTLGLGQGGTGGSKEDIRVGVGGYWGAGEHWGWGRGTSGLE